MTFFEDQYDAWMANNCKGALEDYDSTEFPEATAEEVAASPESFQFGYILADDLKGRLESWDAIRKFIFAGKATFTIRSKKTGARFTYKITKLKKVTMGNANTVHFVTLLRGPDNESDFAYMGCILDMAVFKRTGKSKVSEDAASFKAFRWVFDQMRADKPMRPELEVWHEAKCGRCGRKLTVPESVASGIGPECARSF